MKIQIDEFTKPITPSCGTKTRRSSEYADSVLSLTLLFMSHRNCFQIIRNVLLPLHTDTPLTLTGPSTKLLKEGARLRRGNSGQRSMAINCKTRKFLFTVKPLLPSWLNGFVSVSSQNTLHAYITNTFKISLSVYT